MDRLLRFLILSFLATVSQCCNSRPPSPTSPPATTASPSTPRPTTTALTSTTTTTARITTSGSATTTPNPHTVRRFEEWLTKNRVRICLRSDVSTLATCVISGKHGLAVDNRRVSGLPPCRTVESSRSAEAMRERLGLALRGQLLPRGGQVVHEKKVPQTIPYSYCGNNPTRQKKRICVSIA